MNKLILSTDNQNKIIEIKEALEGLPINIYGKSEYVNERVEVDEIYKTLEDNAKIKAEAIKSLVEDAYILADDTGLFINALNGEPGVHSARYGGDHDDSSNIKKVLDKLKDKNDRSAYFKTVFYLITPTGHGEVIEGKCEGSILTERHGHSGFGYDPIFKPNNLDTSFAQMSIYEKNEISHRGRALKNLRTYLKKILSRS